MIFVTQYLNRTINTTKTSIQDMLQYYSIVILCNTIAIQYY